MAQASTSWPEVAKALSERRHELVLSGSDISNRIDEGGLDTMLFSLPGLNFLEISKTTLTCLPDHVGKLTSITNLVLHSNRLREISALVGSLTHLKILDLSGNQLEELPDDIGKLSDLQSLNVSSNKLCSVPDISGMLQLHILDMSHNQLESLPDGITCPELTVLAQVNASSNKLVAIPAELSQLPALRALDVSDNQLAHIPAELSECFKLKELKFGGNKLKDRRLAKMMDQCTTKSVVDYLRGILQKERQKQGGGGGGRDNKKKQKKRKDGAGEVDDVAQNLMRVLHFNDETGYTVTATPQALLVRPYIVCCVVRHLDFNRSKNMFKRFINLQTKLHDGVCQKRQAATIATHDLQSVKWPLKYHAMKPETIKLTPLFKLKEVTADKLVTKLRQEAEEVRKEKKRNTLSGIYKYLDLLKGKLAYPCLLDKEERVLSLPPVTNSDITKVSREQTTDLLLEVTSSSSLDVCKKVMDELLQSLLELGLGCLEPPVTTSPAAADAAATGGEAVPAAEATASGIQGDTSLHADVVAEVEASPLAEGQHLVVEQVRVVDTDGTLKVVYPSRVDLQSDSYRVSRDGK